jgi:TNF receptor-associated protein 1
VIRILPIFLFSFRKRNLEVLFCYESYDELVLMQLMEFDKKKVTSVEKEMRQVPKKLKRKFQ